MTTTTPNRRRMRGDGGIYQRADGLWCGQIDLGKDGSGKRRRKTFYAKTQKAAQTKMRDLRRQLDERGDLPTTDLTLEKWLDYWLRNVAVKKLKPNTYRSYRTCVTHHIVPAIGSRKLSRLSVEHVDAMHAYVTDTLGLSPTTALNAHRVLSVALNEAVRRDKVARNIAALVSAPSKAESDREGLTAAEAIRVLRIAADQPLGSRWLAAFLLGVRQGERLGLRWSMLNLETGVADLSWALQRVPYRHGCAPVADEPTCGKKRAASCPSRELAIPRGMAHHVLKGNLCLLRPKTATSTRVVAIVEPLRLALLRRRAEVEAERPGYTVDHDLVWCAPDGSPLDPRKDWQAWKDLLVAAGVKDVTGHETRHTTATLLLEAGVAPKVIQELLGHSDVVTTLGYQHVSLALQRQALDDLGRRLELPGSAPAASPSPARKRAPRAVRPAH